MLRSNGHGKPIVALDIDGTLGDYHGHFLRFAEGWFGQSFPAPSTSNPGLKLWEFMGVDVADYRLCKLAYRQGGLKRTMPPYEGAAQLTDMLRNKLGAEVWICTTRPYMRLDNIDPDTREWLMRSGVQYDAVLFDTLAGKGTKYAELRRQAGDRVACIADDLPEMLQAAREQFPTLTPAGQESTRLLLRDQPYNRHVRLGLVGDAHRVHDCWQILEQSIKAVDNWHKREAHDGAAEGS